MLSLLGSTLRSGIEVVFEFGAIAFVLVALAWLALQFVVDEERTGPTIRTEPITSSSAEVPSAEETPAPAPAPGTPLAKRASFVSSSSSSSPVLERAARMFSSSPSCCSPASAVVRRSAAAPVAVTTVPESKKSALRKTADGGPKERKMVSFDLERNTVQIVSRYRRPRMQHRKVRFDCVLVLEYEPYLDPTGRHQPSFPLTRYPRSQPVHVDAEDDDGDIEMADG